MSIERGAGRPLPGTIANAANLGVQTSRSSDGADHGQLTARSSTIRARTVVSNDAASTSTGSTAASTVQASTSSHASANGQSVSQSAAHQVAKRATGGFDVSASATKKLTHSGGYSEVSSVNARIMALIDQIIGEQQQMRSLCKHLAALHEALRNVPPPNIQPVPNVPAVTAQAMIASTDADGNMTQIANPDYATQQAAVTAAQTQASAVQAANAAEESRYWGQVNALQSQIAGVEQELKECIERIDKLQSQIDRLRAVDLPAAERRDRERAEQQMGPSGASSSGSAIDDVSVSADAAKAELRKAQSALNDVRTEVKTTLEPLVRTAQEAISASGAAASGEALTGLHGIMALARQLVGGENAAAVAHPGRDTLAAVRDNDTAARAFVRGGGPPAGSSI